METNNTSSRDPKYQCCCNTMHVEKGAYVIAVIFTAISLPTILAYVLMGNNVLVGNDWLKDTVNPFPIMLFTSLAIFYAQHKREPRVYLAYLVPYGIVMFFLLFYLISSIIKYFFWHDSYINSIHNAHFKERPRNYVADIAIYVFLTSSISLVLLLAIWAWCYWVVVRAYQFMKKENANPVQACHSTTQPK